MASVPPHLRNLVVEQDYSQYTVQDQAVWRFVVMQTHARLLRTAHRAYAAGFETVGIAPDRIARIDEMDARLQELGWSAVCVDGFIPPRAFQAMQAASVLAVAADIRVSGHLTYTPAPDIIHEAAGHAPFLADADYARFLRGIGRVGRRAFASEYDRKLYRAIYDLSELKEDPASTPEAIARAEAAFAALARKSPEPSEAARLARLYWWTVEYGLVGSLERPRLYGAGLLSSIGEGHFCLGPEVEKRRLGRDCIEVSYNITRAQPQLFVAEDFAHLEAVLEEVAGGLSQRQGGRGGLQVAEASAELATLALDCGLSLCGRVKALHVHQDAAYLVELDGECTIAENERVVDELPRSQGYMLPLGTLDDGTPLSALDTAIIARHTDAQGRLALRTAAGVELRGRVQTALERGGHLACISLEDFELREPSGRLRRAKLQPLLLATAVDAVWAGAAEGHEPETEASGRRVPKPRDFDAAQREMLELYERALGAFHNLGGRELRCACAKLVERLDAAYPDEWLLRFNLLESLVKAGEGPAMQGRLTEDLERLELRYGGREPIATGLSYVRALTATDNDSAQEAP
ncbi:MAG: aromatic amino acid hydroxylase [Myxococcales bacterium]|nr:aromatic amino acid hydroxylase [Myxococcales bacterium]